MPSDDDGRPTARGESIPSSVDADAPPSAVPNPEPLDVIDRRLEYLEGVTPRDRAHADSLEARIAELERVRRLISGDG